MMRTRTLLFLEDDEDLQLLVTAYLRDSGYQVKSARNADEARAILARWAPRLRRSPRR